MTATEELCRMLNEREVKWRTYIDNDTVHTTWNDAACWFTEFKDRTTVWGEAMEGSPAQAVEATLGPQITGDTSDGYHTFNELYHHRAVLFSVIVRDHPYNAWKAKKHHDDTMYDGMFIVGIDTPQGQATYHYDIDPYWEMFDCKELDRAPEWDGHTPDDAIARIATLGRGECEINERYGDWYCTGCGSTVGTCDPDSESCVSGNVVELWDFCPHCGRRVRR